MPRGSHPGERRGGRQKGTPNKANAEIKAIARQWGLSAISEAAKLAGLSHDGKFRSGNDQVVVACINVILDRGYGKATQHLAGDGAGGVVMVAKTVDAPPPETREEWLARRKREIAEGMAGKV